METSKKRVKGFEGKHRKLLSKGYRKAKNDSKLMSGAFQEGEIKTGINGII